VLVDGHVHIRAQYSLRDFLDSASRNFQSAAGELGMPADTPGCILLAESAGDDYFDACRNEGLIVGTASPWSVRLTEESTSCFACCEGRSDLLMIAGRQISTQERLEVMALGCTEPIADGQPIEQVIEQAQAAGALVVLPWGAGKWLFKRGRIIEQLLDTCAADRIFLGDNAGRYARLGDPPLFRAAQTRGIRIMPGSDPLPLASEVHAVGRYGFVIDQAVDHHQPTAALRSIISDATWRPRTFGKRVGLYRFMVTQARMALTKGSRRNHN
jgi:hypothetical protein